MTQEIVKKQDKEMEYKPLGSDDPIRLSIAMIRDQIAVKTRSGKTCSDSDAIKFMMMCKARKLNPWEGDAFLIGYDGKDGPVFSLITAHQAFLKRAQPDTDFDGMKSGIIVEEDGKVVELEGDFYIPGRQKLLGGWATLYKKSLKHPIHKRIRLERFQKTFGIWQEDPAGMICKCAEADALRTGFPNTLGSLYMREELPIPDESAKITTPIFISNENPPTLNTGAPEEIPVPKKPAPKAETRKKAEPRDIEVEVVPVAEAVLPDVNGQLKKQIADRGETVETIFRFMGDLIPPSVKTLEDLQTKDPGAYEIIRDSLPEIISQMKKEK